MNYMDMSPIDFDQSDTGWRMLDAQEKYVESAETILAYIAHNEHMITGMNPSLQVLYFHAGQEYAMAGDKYYKKAVNCFEQSYMNSKKWNWYVKGTIAYLNKDKEQLDEAIQNNGMNLQILQDFSDALKNHSTSYKENYNPSA